MFHPEKLAPKPNQKWGIRHLQYFLMFTSIVIGYGMRTTLNIGIISMTSDENNKNYPTYPEWSSKKNLLISSFFWGYICLQVIAGQLAKKFGAKLFLTSAMFLASIFTILIPFFAGKFGYVGVMICRIIQGACQGFFFPSIHALLGVWAPISERVKWGGLVYTGQPVGNVISMPITGLICGSSFGWPAIFYIYGTIGFIWCFFYIIFGSNSPSCDTRITKDEREWIELEIGEKLIGNKVPTPWKSILTSCPFLALLITHCGQNWGYWTLQTEIPSYMEKILHFNIENNSFLSALPYFVMFLLNVVLSPIAELVVQKRWVSLTTSRKIFNSFGHYGPALGLIILCLLGSNNKYLVIFLLVFSVGTNAGSYCGFNINHIDLSPNHAGPLMGITNSVAAIFSTCAPLTVDLISSISGYGENEETLWHLVFYVTASIYAFVATVFIVFGSAKVQSWSYVEVEEEEKFKKSVEVQKKVSFIYIVN